MRPKPSSSESDECRSFEYHRHSWQESTPTFFFSKFGIDRQQEYPFHRYPRLLNISPNDFFVRFRLNKLECSNYSFLSFGYILSSTFLILRPRSFIFPPFSLSLSFPRISQILMDSPISDMLTNPIQSPTVFGPCISTSRNERASLTQVTLP